MPRSTLPRLAGLAIAGGLALTRCLVGFPDYAIGDLDAGGAGGRTGATGGTASGGRGGASSAGANSGGAMTGGRAGSGAVANSGGSPGSGGATGGSAGSATGGSAGAGGVTGRGRLVINEIDYDQPNTDTTEFVEIYNGASTAARLDGVALVLVNGEGTPPGEYNRIALSGTLGSHEFAVVASSLVTVASGAIVFRFAVQNDNIQNGSPDAVGLLDTETHKLIDALSYEGSVTSAVLKNEIGTYDFVEGTPTTAVDGYTQTMSLVRIPDGADSNNAVADWSVSLTPTPGGPNK